ncbi:MAG: PAS-domain containing protein, partial [Pseudomonadota bacterium]
MSDWGDVVSRHSARLYEESLHAFQRQAAEARSQLNAGIQVLTDGFVLYDRHDRLVLCNARFRDFYPKSARALQVGARFEDIVRYGMTQGEYAIEPGREEAWIQERLARHRAADSVIEEQLADGRWLRIVERATPDGGRVGLRIDITEQKRARARLAAIIRGTDAGTWEYNVQTGETIFNDRYMEMLGHSRATFGPSHIDTFRNFVHAEDIARITADLDRHLAGDTPLYQAEFRMRHKEGHHVWVLSRGRVGSWSSGRRALWVYGTHQEITARKEAEASLHAARRAAEQASEAKSAFLAQMSHEIRTPMNGVLAMVEVLADEIENPHHRDLLTTIRDSGEALMRILNDLLDYSKIEACRLEIERIPFVPSDLAARIAALHRHAAEERGL